MDLDPLLTFLESELVPALQDSANDLDSVIKREAIVRQDEPKGELPKSENEKPPVEPKVEPPKVEPPKPEPCIRKEKKSK